MLNFELVIWQKIKLFDFSVSQLYLCCLIMMAFSTKEVFDSCLRYNFLSGKPLCYLWVKMWWTAESISPNHLFFNLIFNYLSWRDFNIRKCCFEWAKKKSLKTETPNFITYFNFLRQDVVIWLQNNSGRRLCLFLIAFVDALTCLYMFIICK